MHSIRYQKLNINKIKKNCKKLFDYEIKSKILKKIIEEVIDYLDFDDIKTCCNNCKVPINNDLKYCWACSSIFDYNSEIKESLNIKSDKEFIKETRSIIGRMDSRLINQKLTELMPDGWKKENRKPYFSYFDHEGTRRISVMKRGLDVHFTVEDGFLDNIDNVDFYDAKERRRRHYGLENYRYVGDYVNEVVEIAKKVFRKYSL